MLKLPNVTLCASDAPNLSLTLRSLAISRSMAEFGDTVLLSELAVPPQPFRVECTPAANTRKGNGAWVINNLAKYITTSHALYTQWDSWIIHTDKWTDRYLQFDYIGALWPWHEEYRVGCGGFCLMSRKLLDILHHTVFPEGCEIDDYICRVMRPHLEVDHDIRFATEEAANQFAYEREAPQNTTFGFHALFNMWRHVDDSEMEKLVFQMADYVVKSPQYVELMMTYLQQHKFRTYQALYRRLEKLVPEMHSHLAFIFPRDSYDAIFRAMQLAVVRVPKN